MALSSPTAAASPSASFSSLDEELAYYKTQYEQLESELQDFQASSRELEAELERDIEASEKRERQLKEKVEKLAFEVEEWKTKCKQSKIETNHAQTSLQKEITLLRDSNRTLQLKLRDIEVANDDYERQARHTTSSLEDLESKYNVSIERGVMLEEEIKLGEQEREGLRIENQRLREELSDLKIETEIIQEKLRLSEAALERHQISPIRATRSAATNSHCPHSPASTMSASITTFSSPIDPSPAFLGQTIRTESTPPSPPLSDPASMAGIVIPKNNSASRSQFRAGPSLNPAHGGDTSSSAQPHPSWKPGASMSRHARTFSGSTNSTAYSMANSTTASRLLVTSARRPSTHHRAAGAMNLPYHSANGAANLNAALPRSGSLNQIRGLIGKMQMLEKRVHNARMKLPTASSTSTNHSEPNITVRSPKKRQSINNSVSGSVTPTRRQIQTPSAANISRMGARTPIRDLSVASTNSAATTTTGTGSASRPPSRASGLSKSVMGAPPSYIRPSSQASNCGYSTRPGRSSSILPSQSPTAQLAAPGSHGYSRSIGYVDSPSASPIESSTPHRRTTLDQSLAQSLSAAARPSFAASNVVAPLSSSGRRKSSGLPVRRQSSAYSSGRTSPTKPRVSMAPPVPPLPPFSPSAENRSTASAGSTPGRAGSRLAIGRARAPTAMSNSTTASSAATETGGVGLNAESDRFDDIGETF